MDKHLRFNKKCKLALLLLLSVAGMMKTIAENPPTGAINGLFSVSATQQVYFSQGNLQYRASTNTWRFATNQYDYVGSTNSNISSTCSGWIDLFAWGTSGYNHGAVCYQPWSISENNSDYLAYGYSSYNLNEQSGQADWGYNAISNGGNQTNQWRTLTKAEWVYLLNTRNTLSGIRFAMAKVNNVNGVIILPDNWSSTYYALNNTNNTSASFNSNSISLSSWSTLEANGAVFLPAAGFRDGTYVYGVGSYGGYQTATYYNSNGVYDLYFSNSNLLLEGTCPRSNAQSVRLVRSVPTYTINASSIPSRGGSVTGMGNYIEGQFCTLTAAVNEGYTFVNWVENGEQVSTEASYSFTVTSNRSLEAHFSFNFAGAIDGLFSVSATQKVYFSQGNLQYQASTSTWRFADNQYDYIGDANSNISSSYSGWIDLFGWGTSGWSCGNIYYHPWDLNNTDGSLYGPPGQYDLTGSYANADWGVYNPISNGGNTSNRWRTLTQSEWRYVITARTTDSGIRFAKAQVNGVNGVILLPDDWNPSTYSLNYTDTRSASFDSNVITAIQWTTLENAGAIFLPAAGYRDGTLVYNVGTTGYYWSASASLSYNSYHIYFYNRDLLTNWYDDLRYKGKSVRLVRVGSQTFMIDATANPAEGGEVSGMGTYQEGTECTLTATPNVGYTFVNWTKNGTVVSTNASYTFTVTEAGSYVAHFQLNSYQITASATPSTGGSISGAGTYNHGSNCTLTASNNTGYTFVNWTKNGTVVSTNASYTFTVIEAGSYVAHFQLNSYQITASSTPSEGGSVSGSGTYSYGSSCTLTATNSTGYTFVNWTENGEVVSTDNPYTFTVNGAVELTANFSLDSYEITAIADPTAGGTISGTGTYNHFSSCTLTATTNTGYAFRSWNVNGETVSTENPYTFTVSGAVELTANFDAQETTTLDNGWTWWSTSIEMSDFDGLTMLEESLGHNGLMIKSANKFVQNYYPSTGYDYWFGQLTSDDFTNASSYMIQTSASCEVTMTGTYADPSDHPIQLYPGWTWIGYPCGTEQSAASAFANFTPTVNDKVKSQYAFSTYYDNYGWFPEFTMTQGEGYLYQSLASNTRTLTFANGSKDNLQEANEEDRYWRNNIHAYADNMNVIAVVTVDSVEQQGEDLELGAFVDGECRGSAVLKHFIPTGRWYAMLTVMGTDGDQIEFGIIDKGKGLTSMTSDRSLVFQANAVVGELDEPYTIGFGTLGCVENNLMGAMHIYPNPIDRNTAFSIVIPETETVRSIYIVNMMGEVMAHETNMTRSLSIQAPGVYTIKVECHSGNVYVGKLIVK